MRAIKVRVYPSKQQELMINKSFGCVRFVYNRALALKKSRYESHGDNLIITEISKMVTFWKTTKELSFLKEANAQSLQQTLRHLDIAYKNFFKNKKGFPAFKKKSDNQSYSVVGNVKLAGSKIQFPKLGALKIKGLRKFEGKIKTATLSKNRAGQFFVSFCVNDVKKTLKVNNVKSAVGIDVGIKSLVTVSNGASFVAPNALKAFEDKLRFYQRQQAKCTKSSRSFKKWKHKIAVVWCKITNIKKDYIHKLSIQLVKSHDLIVVENLKIKNMVKNHKLARSISNMSWGELFRQLEYKSEWHGKHFVKIDPKGTSQECSRCGFINKSLALKDRCWECSWCRTVLDRDLNAAINIRKKGMDSVLKSCGDILVREVDEARIPLFLNTGSIK